MCVIVTGNGLYKYFHIKDQDIEQKHSQMNNKDPDLSTSFTCHTWLTDGRLIVCTAEGEIMMLESSGEYKKFIQ